ncbi:peptidase M14 [Maribacter sp. ANRC-HE7]|uniref:Peptidase M14 n=1 Tax=Maribacter aquimaris TaxID=2737171 RepID=A0ABR7V3E3_9FLAO|nr:M14 family zinc carboxypeptidase [Maribacter aquimaris]MBD0777831.1 peptidase M14 [Maribacter aquimaris]
MKNILIIIFLLFNSLLYGQNKIKVSSDFPGGNIVVNKVSGDTVWVKPDLSFTSGKWFYWYFKVSGVSNKTVTFKFDQKNVFGKYGPAYSINNDENWKWYGENRIKNNSFSFTFSEKDTVGFFSIAFPYTEKNLDDFLEDLPNKESLIIDTLCFSPENRTIEKIIIPSLNKDPKYKVLITSRHHACEMMASYVLEGIIKSILNDKDLQQLREDVEFMIVPFMDKDGVENGEQGKNRIPRDHNRDYSGDSKHHSTATLRTVVPAWSNNKLRMALDIHCPWISGEGNESIYIVGMSNPKLEREQKVFSQLLEENAVGELKSYHKDFLPFGKSWNTDANYSKGMGFTQWAGSLEGISLATTIEFPYANISGLMVSKDNARIFGQAVAYSIMDYLESLD